MGLPPKSGTHWRILTWSFAMRIPFLSVLFALSALPAAAQQSCLNAVTNSELIDCASDEYKIEDDSLNDGYQRVLEIMANWDANLPADERGAVKALKEGQRAWIIFRDKTCEAEGYIFKGGSAEALVVIGCKTILTQERNNQIYSLIESVGDY